MQFLGHRFEIQFYPQGRDEAPPGHFSLTFRFCSDLTAHFQAVVNGTQICNMNINTSQDPWKGDHNTMNIGNLVNIFAGTSSDRLAIMIRFSSVDNKNVQAMKDERLTVLEGEVKEFATRCRALENQGKTGQAERERLNAQCTDLEKQVSEQKSQLHNVTEEKLRLRCLIDESFPGSQERVQRVGRAVVQIQAFWRMKICQCRLPARLYQSSWQQEMQKPQTTCYDIILAFDSLANFLEHRQLSLLQKAESHLKLAELQRYRIVAVVGLFDKGKTWLMNKLFGVSLPSGKLHTTKGFSFIWIEERNMLVLDSAGVQSPVSFHKVAVDTILDAQTTESLMFEMISRIAHHMIFVVNDLTLPEQRCLEMLERKYKQRGQHKELIVVHNFRDTTEAEEAVTLFERQVRRCYPGVMSHLGQLIFTADVGEGAPPAHHIGLCNEFSLAGDKFNQKNREYLLQSLEHRNTAGEGITLSAKLCEEFARLLHPYFVNIETAAEHSVSASDQALQVEFCPVKDAERSVVGDYICVGKVALKLARKDDRLTMKKVGKIGPLGEIYAHDVSFIPNVNVVDKTTPTGVQRLIHIECPGVTQEDIELDKLPNGVGIKIDRKPLIDEKEVVLLEGQNFCHGIWEQDFHVDVSDGTFELDFDASFVQDGVLCVVMTKAMKKEKLRFGKKARTSSPVASEASLGSFSLVPQVARV